MPWSRHPIAHLRVWLECEIPSDDEGSKGNDNDEQRDSEGAP